jgi:hypothetical protein
MTHPQDQAELRLRAADPVGPSRALPPPRIERAELLEAIMSTTTDTIETTTGPSRNSFRPRWLLAAAAVLAIGTAGTVVALTAGNDSGQHPIAARTVETLKLPAPQRPGITSCIRFSVDVLRGMQVAFDGTVTEVTDNDVLLTVNHWYKGGSADEVRLTSLQNERVALEGTVDFTVGRRYLVTANDGTVTYCGFTEQWSAELQKDFQQAFGG